MAGRSPFTLAALNAFDAAYDTANEDLALQSRGAFLKAFPIRQLAGMTIDQYVIGLQSPTFCSYVEAKTRHWAAIQGSPAFKFGVYFGKTKSDPHKRYHPTRKFGNNAEEAFAAVKASRLELVHEGAKRKPDFAAIDANPLSQMFKAKILSLYFADRFLAVCSTEPLELLAGETGLPDNLHRSEIQNRLLDVKADNPITRSWSNPKFMRFLYDTYVRQEPKEPGADKKPRKKTHRKVNFEDIQAQRGDIGKKAEKFALQWEKDRLIGAELAHLIDDIDDRTDRPGYGYDFFSHTSARKPRYIEVKSISKHSGQHRFFLSDNEHTVSCSPEHRNAYYFYLVAFNGEGEPVELTPRLAANLYATADIAPASYTVLFDLEHSLKDE
jgi:Domain of unknown function (DUF3883)